MVKAGVGKVVIGMVLPDKPAVKIFRGVGVDSSVNYFVTEIKAQESGSEDNRRGYPGSCPDCQKNQGRNPGGGQGFFPVSGKIFRIGMMGQVFAGKFVFA